MTFFEQELRKIVGAIYPDAKYIGRAAYVDLGGGNRAKLRFITMGIADNYEALCVDIINQFDGKVDTNTIRFGDVIGKQQTGNHNLLQGIKPHFWSYNDTVEWYVYKPAQADYDRLTAAVSDYTELFEIQTQEMSQEQTM